MTLDEIASPCSGVFFLYVPPPPPMNHLSEHYDLSLMTHDDPRSVRDFKRMTLEAGTLEPRKFLLSAAELESRSDADVEDMLSHSRTVAIRRVLDGDTAPPVAIGSLKLNPLEKRRHYAEVSSMYVVPECRGQGLASAMLLRLIDEARTAAVSVLELYVTAENDRAIALYENNGFMESGHLPKALRVGDGYIDGRYMVRVLDDDR